MYIYVCILSIFCLTSNTTSLLYVYIMYRFYNDSTIYKSVTKTFYVYLR